jgi:NAD(P)H dehydrogenase (quinone)
MTRPLKHAIIVAHPEKGSFTSAIAERYAEAVRARGHEVIFRDLYRLGFDPVLKAEERQGRPGADVVAEWDALGDIDVFVLAYPIWFGAPPAILVGYIDRVLGAGRARGEDQPGSRSAVLHGRHLVSLTLSGSMSAWLDEKGVLESLRTVYDRYLGEVFGLPETHHFHFDGVQPGLPERDYRFHLAQAGEAAVKVLGRIQRLWSRNPNAGELPFEG